MDAEEIRERCKRAVFAACKVERDAILAKIDRLEVLTDDGETFASKGALMALGHLKAWIQNRPEEEQRHEYFQ